MKELIENFKDRFRTSLFKQAVVLAFMTIVIIFLLLVKHYKGIPIGYFTRDPNTIADSHFYAGFFSQLGVMFWAAAATICFFSAYIVSKTSNSSEKKHFLLGSGLLTIMLAFDDVFQVHEQSPKFGIHEVVIFGSYGLLAIYGLFRYFNTILKTNFVLLGMAFFFFGFSLLSDYFNWDFFDRHLLEDGPKLTGIIYWLIYFSHTSYFMLLDELKKTTPAPQYKKEELILS